MDLQRHIELAVKNAEAGISKLPAEILKMEGMSGLKTRHFYNNLLNIDDARYLEIGTWKGSSVCSAMYGNSAKIYVIDNWSGFGGPRDEFLKNYEKFKGKNSTSFQEEDSFKVDVLKLPKFNFYMYDGDHSSEAQCKALTYYIDAMDETFVYICDDWNYDKVREGTHAGIKELGLEVVWSKEILMTNDGSHTPQPLASQTWHNGIYMAIFRKPRPAEKYTIIINAYNRDGYLDRCLESLSKNDGLYKWTVVYHQDGFKTGGFCPKTAAVANKWLDKMQANGVEVYRNFYIENKNIAVRQYDAIIDAFETRNSDYLLVMEDDTVPGFGYVETIKNLLHYTKDLPEFGFVSGHYTRLKKWHSKYEHYSIVDTTYDRHQITWLTGHSRKKWEIIKDVYKEAHKLIFADRPYQPPGGDFTEYLIHYDLVFNKLGLKPNNCYCQDVMLGVCYEKFGMGRILVTTDRNALPIGEEGLHFNKEIFDNCNYGTEDDWNRYPWRDFSASKLTE